ncbi:LytR family transcriptional attenuator [Streptomyces sp. 2333.5]|uniref:LCP family protein n=1 Tax=unclassified Streptomyces TaxID=2593676 RepID=UPI0008982C82|nr:MULTISPECIES: LCP family protein [unclassified Streptomyces]PJJ00179.1 LytR family transcriptional attenuator [Streptomyces sp. 2333.5]SEC66062.1 transcriptional attenuator, LytR family [Streptomyces sp. 2112.2]
MSNSRGPWAGSDVFGGGPYGPAEHPSYGAGARPDLTQDADLEDVWEAGGSWNGRRIVAGEVVDVTESPWREDPPRHPHPAEPFADGYATPQGPPWSWQEEGRADRGDGPPDGGVGRTDREGAGTEQEQEQEQERPGAARRSHRSRRRRPVRRVVIGVLVVLLAIPAGTLAWADTKLNTEVDLGTPGQGQQAGKGTNYLIVGSDSREGLTDEEKRDLHTGSAGGRRTDSMILLHTGAGGTTMVSLPRDSWLTVPGYTSPMTGKHHGPVKDKLNAAFAVGGPKMLVRTIERNTGVPIHHYVEVGFAGFVNLVNAVGGVPICLDRDLKDKKSGANFTKGCHTLDGRAALAFVRQRHQEAQGDLGRSKNQRKFLSALAHRAGKPGTVLNPFSLYGALNAGLDTLIVDRETGLVDLARMFRAVQGVTGGHGKQINVPVASLGFRTRKGSAVLWDKAQAHKLFSELNADRPVDVKDKAR